jgi:transitional endoplasmic reticulum ATPase
VGKGIARIDHAAFEQLNLKDEDIVVLEGRKKTAVRVHTGYYEDVGKSVIRIDGTVRKNAGTSIDDKIKVRKIEPVYADKITIAALQPLKIKGGEEYFRNQLLDKVIAKSDMLELTIMGRKIEFVVQSYSPSSAEGVIVQQSTSVKIGTKEGAVVIKPETAEVRVPKVMYEDIGGLDDAIKKVRELVELPLKYPMLFDRLGVEAPKGILLHGPPGTGKTLLAKAVATETDAHFLSISGPEIMSKFYGESEERLRKIFEYSERNAPAVIFIDELDSIAPKREEVTSETERRIVAQLLALMDGLQARGKVIVIGATNRPNAIDPALRRPGRFDREIAIGIPDRDSRLEILQIHTRGMPLAEDVNLAEFADITHGYTGADIAALAKEAAMRALRRILPKIDLESDFLPADVLSGLTVCKQDFIAAFREGEPSALREVVIESPNVRWTDIGGLDDAKREIIESVEWPLKYPHLFSEMHTKSPKGILLYGPPGTGKTLLAKAVATETEANFICVKGPEFHSKWVGESEKAVRETFRKARMAAPCIIFFDEIDAIVPVRGRYDSSQVTERVVSQILTEMDGIEELHGIVVIAATNRPDIIDTALLRPGRFDKLIYIPLPDEKARKQIFEVHTSGKPLSADISLDRLAEITENYTGADIAAVCNEAAMLCIREAVEAGGKLKNQRITAKHFEDALQKIRPMSKQLLEQYAKFTEQFKKRFA